MHGNDMYNDHVSVSPHRLAVRLSALQAEDDGSNPSGGAILRVSRSLACFVWQANYA